MSQFYRKIFYHRYVKVFGLEQVGGETVIATIHPTSGFKIIPLPFNLHLRNYALLSTGVGKKIIFFRELG